MADMSFIKKRCSLKHLYLRCYQVFITSNKKVINKITKSIANILKSRQELRNHYFCQYFCHY